ncbi:purine nucleoside permease, putative [Talaromyces stipitatus ATCC 10500]|uniref:Purine nucleoside permease, putative n=1 Tax=Talaromyces stipitatus (strain ATCC 10500 / CBS 375.48 / QM 6759 / NRRL 1006) TaxID=441959 RepID=B8MMD1_TALSN|nr:purine nucleoside permease, putative [Talaromyces stipitatus ATCC 10500]EED13685.1 purine nucleoside permease, putative [Talaromyces stipitatus ATCC 10500]
MLALKHLLAGLAIVPTLIGAAPVDERCDCEKPAPKVFIISMFAPEAEVWWGIPEFNLLAHNISIPGLSPLFPHVHCTENHEICQLITGESEINAATTISSVAFSDKFDLTSTYFFIGGIAGINPEVATTGSVTFARYAIQVALQYELDAREIPSNWSTGYWAQGSYGPNQYPESIYGTEVFEVNVNLRSKAVAFARKGNLTDSAQAASYRAQYLQGEGVNIYQAGAKPPSVVECDVATSDVYYTGNLLSEAFDNTTRIFTNGTGTYCSTAQEDNATLEVLTRAALHKKVDFARIIVMRTASDFDRPYPGEDAAYHILYANQDGFEIAIQNIYRAGVHVVQGILNEWEETFKCGVKPDNYIGDIFGTLGGNPNFGPGREIALKEGGALLTKRGSSVKKMRSMRKKGVVLRK